MELDRQSIERRDFPIIRRGYDPAAVDAHLRALSVEIEELQRAALAGGDPSMAASAATQVQVIVEAAQAAAVEIERHAGESARQVREAADRDAERTREEAIERARAHVGAVGRVAASLLERVGSMDSEVHALVESLRSGAGRLATDLVAVEGNMAELYDSTTGQPIVPAPVAQPASAAFETQLADAIGSEPQYAHEEPAPAPVAALDPQTLSSAAGVDVDGARLIALNMALNGESREETERYLAENFELPDRNRLVDEVYAAIEG